MRKLFSLFMALLATTSLWAEDFSVGGIYYNYLDGNNVEVTYRGWMSSDYGNEYSGAIVIPATVYVYGTTYNVTSIGDGAFAWCTDLTSITIPNSVTSIGESAFARCSRLTPITIPNSVTSIEEYTFAYCHNLTSISIPNSVTSIGDGAFLDCSGLTSITIPNSVTSIGSSAFHNCSGLTSATIGNSVTSIGREAFKYCSGLTFVSIGNSVTIIGDAAFEGCSSLTSITIPNSVTSIGDGVFEDCYSLTSITIPNSVTSIGSSAFRNCSGLTSISIPNSVTSIGDFAFRSCSGLTSITIPNSVTSIGDGAFYYTGIYNNKSNWESGVLYISNCLIKANISGACTIKEGTRLIATSSFRDCSGLTSVTIPNSVTSIGDYAFRECYGLTSITIPNSVTSIGREAFTYCSDLTFIESWAEVPPTLGSSVFDNVYQSIPVYVPCGSVSAYQSAYGWKAFTNIQELLAGYSIAVDVSDNKRGTAKVDKNTICGAQITATANYGYHFVQWSDGNTDNPRTLVLTQDTTFTAEFALNQYSITTTSADPKRGSTAGDTTVNYLDYVSISAIANYGYHFAKWNDGNADNPRVVQVIGDTTYTADFDKNMYTITTNWDDQMGSVNAPNSAEYLDQVTISATANHGYHFTQWSDGITKNPRTLVLTQDTTFTAEFAQTFSGQCGDNLYWTYDEDSKKISITGSGDMYDYTKSTQPWYLFQEQITEVTTSNTTTSVGKYAFAGCARLAKVSLGYGMENIAANAFAECKRLYDIYVYATYPPFAEESSFANYNVYLYIPCENQRDYILDIVWGKFKFIECIGAESDDTGGDDIVITPGSTDVTITWPTEDDADTYSIVITKDGEVFCTLTFNSNGQLVSIAFAPGRRDNHPAQYAEATVNGYCFTVTGLEEGTKYAYNLDVKDSKNQTIQSYSGEFVTKSDVPTSVSDIQSPISNCQKLIRNGQLIIILDGVEYNAQGVRL